MIPYIRHIDIKNIVVLKFLNLQEALVDLMKQEQRLRSEKMALGETFLSQSF